MSYIFWQPWILFHHHAWVPGPHAGANDQVMCRHLWLVQTVESESEVMVCVVQLVQVDEMWKLLNVDASSSFVAAWRVFQVGQRHQMSSQSHWQTSVRPDEMLKQKSSKKCKFHMEIGMGSESSLQTRNISFAWTVGWLLPCQCRATNFHRHCYSNSGPHVK